MQEYLEIGQVVNTHGLKGMLKVNPFVDDQKQFEEFRQVFLQTKKEMLLKQVQSVGYQKKQVLLKLEGIDTIEEAEKYKGCYLKISRQQLGSLPKDTYYISDLLEMQVVTEEGKTIGIVEDIFQTGSNDVYVIQTPEGKQLLIPARQENILKIDLNQKQITVKLLEGLY